MDRTITIDHPYQRITLDFDLEKIKRINAEMARPLSTEQWTALEKAERRVYYPGGMGCNGYTDVMVNDGDQMLNEIWSLTATGVESSMYDQSAASQLHEVATRVAQVYAIMNFGAEMLLKG